MRLSSRKAARGSLVPPNCTGNPGPSWATFSRPLRQAQGRLCGTEYWIGRFLHRLFRAGLPRRAGAGTFGGRPSRPRIHVDFAVSFLSQLAASKSAPPTARSTACRDRRGRRDDKGEGSAHLSSRYTGGTCGFSSAPHANSKALRIPISKAGVLTVTVV
jgi:hypothetical protein